MILTPKESELSKKRKKCESLEQEARKKQRRCEELVSSGGLPRNLVLLPWGSWRVSPPVRASLLKCQAFPAAAGFRQGEEGSSVWVLAAPTECLCPHLGTAAERSPE